VCHCQHAYAVIICEQGDLLLDGKRHDSHVDIRDRGDIESHVSYMLDKAGIGDLDLGSPLPHTPAAGSGVVENSAAED
jgi:hypothetical protein